MYLKQETDNYHMPYVTGVKTFFNHTRGKATSKTNCSLKRLKMCLHRILKNEVTSSDAKNFILHVITVDIYTSVPYRRNQNYSLLHISARCNHSPAR
jgi:hypothetical protein